jgi:isopentenyl-diphosphate Delta-isomerase
LPKDEVVDLVDASDSVIGEATLRECLERGLLHRAAAVQIMRRDGRYLLQVRSVRDPWHPGLWTVSSTGHVRKGESYQDAAKRELFEELGIIDNLVYVKKYLLPPISGAGMIEHEWVSLFASRTDQTCKIDPDEVGGVREVSYSELRKLVANGPLTPDARIILSDYLATR